MRTLEAEGRMKIIRSGRAEVKGIGLSNFRFTRLWLCLTEDELLFFKDSSSALSKPSASIPFSDIQHCCPDTTRANCLRVTLASKLVHISFKTAQELRQWSSAIEVCLQPVLLIGGAAPAENLLSNEEFHDRYLSTSSPVCPKRGKFAHRESTLTGTTLQSDRTGRFSSWSGWTAYDFNDDEWPEFSEFKIEDEKCLNDIDEVEEDSCDAERSPSPVDPELVFEVGRVHLAVSGYPVPRELDLGVADLTGQICKLDDHAAAVGGFSDIWRGTWDANGRSKTVAIKVIRSFCFDSKTEAKVRKRLNQELDIWKKLQHVHIVPLYGVVNDMGHYASMVSPWMENGNASKYFEGQDVQTTLPRRLKLLYEVASGLEYLHCFSPPIIHGDLKASNILVSDSGHALLTDFGISTLIEEATGTEQSASTFAGSVRWMAFELFNPYGSMRSIEESQGSVQLTTYSDIWSFGSTVLEVLSGKLPYYYRKKDVQVVHEILLGIKPLRDELRSAYPSISSEIWTFLLTCWKDDPRSRPSITHVKETISHLFKERRRMGIVFNEEGFL